MKPNAPSTSLLKVARIGAAHGLKGYVKCHFMLDDLALAELINPYCDRDGQQHYSLSLVGEAGKHSIISIEGVRDRTQAEALRGLELYIPADRLPQPDDDEFYYDQLVGLEVVDASGALCGHVHAVHDFGAGDILEIVLMSGNTSRREMVPFTREVVPQIDIANGRLTVCLPEETVHRPDEGNDTKPGS